MNGRYSRQELFEPIGEAGQKKIGQAHVLIIGAGALGSASAEMLVRSGVGKLTIVDRDILDWTNLQRQQLYTEQDVMDKLPKVVAAKRRLGKVNSLIEVEAFTADVTVENAEELVKGKTLIVDATDNIETRLLMNDAALKAGIPFFMGAVVASYGLTYAIGMGEHPCLHCLLDTLPPQTLTCDTAGVISPIVQVVASHQVTNVFKYIVGEKVDHRLKSFDLWKGDQATIDVTSLRRRNCPSCSERAEYPFLSRENQTKTAVLCGRDTVQLTFPGKRIVELRSLAESIRPIVSNLISNIHLIACEYEGHRIVLFRDGRMLVHGTKNVDQAKSVAAQLLG
ncbi:sulfur carrier protein ThiS adenylyltransferase [Siminovitchia terrae]|uniref:Sulfur carrier protein ThiS adenylyltransferase n=1 Tax=Siminovitchia terrae TaxID=1914933 RepID=A0ABQ4KU72_SIMTE|nr:ThiF family adenylyltransferase [Siminovitchia terrae]GIN90727.1 sulfur carrier protein ThiS adenylyltransferase [Siminovitchia terrae]GIN95540.1 sulfur carrier protein ThiS adenylyltransferase [Siminovitchia terrae]